MQQLTVMAISSRTSYTVGTSGMAPTALSFRTTCRQRTQSWSSGAVTPTVPHQSATTSVSADGLPQSPGHAQGELTVWLVIARLLVCAALATESPRN